jgi:hypothetical protein
MYGMLTRWLPAPDPQGPITCDACGCRLVDAGNDGTMWRHFSSLHPGQDARGCRTKCVDAVHGRDGLVIERQREPIPFMIDQGMDETLMVSREDVAAA